MKQEDKELLLKELCARLPYGVKVNAPFTTNKNENAKGYKINSINFGVVEWTPILFGEKKQRNSIIIETFSEKFNQYCSMDIELNNDIERVKLYLFPMSSMTEEQKEELLEITDAIKIDDTGIYYEEGDTLVTYLSKIPYTFMCKVVTWCYKNHLDINNLIPLNLAIDATGLNIY